MKKTRVTVKSAAKPKSTGRRKSSKPLQLSSDGRHPAGMPGIGFPVVGIGASAGGLEAFIGLLEHIPADTGLGFVLVQHLDPDHESALVQILSRVTSMPVVEGSHGLRIEPNHVYIIPPNAD